MIEGCNMGRKRINLTGQKFGKLTVLKDVGRDKGGHITWLCSCECSNTSIVRIGDLKSGKTKSCGCNKGNKTHGMCGTSTYNIWEAMLQRCNNPKHKYYKDYGGRGITACDRWKKFENFFEDMDEKPDGKEIDRKDNNEGYNKENCRWVTPKENSRNKRNTIIIALNDINKPLVEWCEEYNINYGVVKSRLKYNWSIERALTTPIKNTNT